MSTHYQHTSDVFNPYEHISNPYENLWIYYIEGKPENGVLEMILPLTAKLLNNNNGIQNSIFIGNWEEDGFSFLFFSAPCDELVQKIVEQDKRLTLIDRYEMTGEAWHGEQIESYTSGSLCISPPWKPPCKILIPFVNQTDLKHILLDPGVVFGTGRHPTTEDCLRYIEYLCRNESIPSRLESITTKHGHESISINQEPISTVLDIGTGTGLLAIAAAVLGCKKVLAVDFNLLAVKTALNNIRLNSLEDKVLAVQGKAEDFVAFPADIVVANIHYDVMKNLLEIPEFFQHPWLILSGLLRSEVNKVVEKLKKEKVNVVETVSPDGVWNTILVKGHISQNKSE